MKMSFPYSTPTAIEYRIMEEAIKNSIEKEGNDSTVDSTYFALVEISEKSTNERIRESSHDMAYVMQKFVHRKKGIYSKYFYGPTSDIFENPITSLELETLGEAHELINVMLNSVISIGFQEIRMLPRNIPKFFLIDEAWRLLTDPSVAAAVELGVRTFRKRMGSFGVLTQGLSDFASDRVEEQKIPTGRQIIENCDFSFILKQKPQAVERARASGAIHLSADDWDIITNLEKESGLFSEVFMMTPGGNGVSRIIVDKYSYYCYTTEGREAEKMASLVKHQNLTQAQAAQWMVDNWS